MRSSPKGIFLKLGPYLTKILQAPMALLPSLADACFCVVASIELTGRRRACLLRTRSPHQPSETALMPKMYEALAEAFHAEGVDTQFILMGDGNMHWSTAFAKLPGVHTVHVRHEHSTVAAATAYNVATGKIAVASVTCGPGLTQVMTALPAAVRARLPMVVFAGESPINAKLYNQYID